MSSTRPIRSLRVRIPTIVGAKAAVRTSHMGGKFTLEAPMPMVTVTLELDRASTLYVMENMKQFLIDTMPQAISEAHAHLITDPQ